nr:MAG TPA: hypothetical protein [Caudoviricetes sp.]
MFENELFGGDKPHHFSYSLTKMTTKLMFFNYIL